MKKFIMTSPYQPEGNLQKSVYKAADNQTLQYDKEISFPILAAINGYASQGEEIEVIVILSDYQNAKNNYKKFCQQLDEVCKEKKLKCSGPVKVEVPYNDLLDTQLEIFDKLTKLTQDGDTLYACTTYGTKAIPIVEMMALNYAYKVHKDVSIGCVVYGAIDFNTRESKIYDITSLFYMNEIVDVVSKQNVSDPAEAIRMLLK